MQDFGKSVGGFAKYAVRHPVRTGLGVLTCAAVAGCCVPGEEGGSSGGETEQTVSAPVIELYDENLWHYNPVSDPGGYAYIPETNEIVPLDSNFYEVVNFDVIGDNQTTYSATYGDKTTTKIKNRRVDVEFSGLENIFGLQTRLEKVGGGYMNVGEAIQYLEEQNKIGRGTSPDNMEGDFNVDYYGVSSSGTILEGSSNVIFSNQDGLSIDYNENGWLDVSGSIVGDGNKSSVFLAVDYNDNDNVDWVDIIYGNNDSFEKKKIRLFTECQFSRN